MTHRTFRHLDTPVRLFGLSWRQWTLVIVGAALAWSAITLLRPPAEVGLWLATVLVGVPAAVGYYATDGSAGLGTQLADLMHWWRRRRCLPAPLHPSEVSGVAVLVDDRPDSR